MATDYSELRRLLAEIWTAPSQDRRDAIRRQFEAALPGLLGRIAQLEAAIPRLVALITCDMGPDCPSPEYWPDCAISVAKEIARAALAEGKERA